jgi:hypothetical protein
MVIAEEALFPLYPVLPNQILNVEYLTGENRVRFLVIEGINHQNSLNAL